MRSSAVAPGTARARRASDHLIWRASKRPASQATSVIPPIRMA